MPIYEYQCSGCNKILEIIQKISDAPLKECPECKGELRKMISNTSFVLKGGGWYVTDYPSKERKEGLKSEKPASSKDDSSSKKSSEKKSSETSGSKESTSKSENKATATA